MPSPFLEFTDWFHHIGLESVFVLRKFFGVIQWLWQLHPDDLIHIFLPKTSLSGFPPLKIVCHGEASSLFPPWYPCSWHYCPCHHATDILVSRIPASGLTLLQAFPFLDARELSLWYLHLMSFLSAWEYSGLPSLIETLRAWRGEGCSLVVECLPDMH